MKSWLLSGRGIAALIAISILFAALAGCARSDQSLACAKLQRGQWVQVQGHWGVVRSSHDRIATVRFPAVESTYDYHCEDLQ